MKKFLVSLLLMSIFAIGGFAAYAVADNGNGNGNGPPSTPGAAHEKVTLCHRTGSESNPYVEITVNFNSVEDAQHVGGHLEHSGDIIPPYKYSDSHGSFSFSGQGDQSVLANGCKAVVTTTTAPTTTARTTTVTTTTATTTTVPKTTTVTTTVPVTTTAPAATVTATTPAITTATTPVSSTPKPTPPPKSVPPVKVKPHLPKPPAKVTKQPNGFPFTP